VLVPYRSKQWIGRRLRQVCSATVESRPRNPEVGKLRTPERFSDSLSARAVAFSVILVPRFTLTAEREMFRLSPSANGSRIRARKTASLLIATAPWSCGAIKLKSKVPSRR
jgi:hypothetical protein